MAFANFAEVHRNIFMSHRTIFGKMRAFFYIHLKGLGLVHGKHRTAR